MRNALMERVYNLAKETALCNSAKDLYDEGVVRESIYWCLYGAHKGGKQPYKVNKVYRKMDNKLLDVTDKFNAR